MNMNNCEIANLLKTQLGLQQEPVALRFYDDPPIDIPRLDTEVISACAIWRKAEHSLFYATASDHFRCTLGSMVMGFDLPDEQAEELQSEAGLMCEISYVREEEIEHIPTVSKKSKGIIYGPLSAFNSAPDVVIIWANPTQAMLIGEGCCLINWSAQPAGLTGRPGCAAIPNVLRTGSPAQSLGCIGMRTNTKVSDDLILMVLPGHDLDNLSVSISNTIETNMSMESHYIGKQTTITSVNL